MRSRFCGIPLDTLYFEDALDILEGHISNRDRKLIYFLNAHCFNLAVKNENYRNSLIEADYVFNDGIGVKLGALIKGIKVKSNLNGTDLIPGLLKYVDSGKLFILGTDHVTIEKAKSNISDQFKNIEVVGSHHGFFNNDREITELINQSGANILIVGMGVPKQEIWLTENFPKINSVNIAFAGGAIIDFIGGKFPRAPKFFRKIGIEWVYRLLQEPKRLWRRYILGNFLFFFNVITFK